MKLLFSLLFLATSFFSHCHTLSVGEWEMIDKNRKKHTYYKKRNLQWVHNETVIKSCNEYEWGVLDGLSLEIYATNAQLDIACRFITYDNNTMVVSEESIKAASLEGVF